MSSKLINHFKGQAIRAAATKRLVTESGAGRRTAHIVVDLTSRAIALGPGRPKVLPVNLLTVGLTVIHPPELSHLAPKLAGNSAGIEWMPALTLRYGLSAPSKCRELQKIARLIPIVGEASNISCGGLRCVEIQVMPACKRRLSALPVLPDPDVRSAPVLESHHFRLGLT
jgi:hypothetical protein